MKVSLARTMVTCGRELWFKCQSVTDLPSRVTVDRPSHLPFFHFFIWLLSPDASVVGCVTVLQYCSCRGGLMTLSTPLLLRCRKGQAQCIPVGQPAFWADIPGLLVREMAMLVILTVLKSMVTGQEWPRPSLPRISTQLSRSGSANNSQWAKSGHHGFCK